MNELVIYEIVIRGSAGEHILARIADDFEIGATDDGNTRLLGTIRDAAHLHGVITYLTSLAIDLISITPADEVVSPNHPCGNAPESERQP